MGTPVEAHAAAVQLNAFVRNLLFYAPGGIWYYTEMFAGTNEWTQTQFNGIALYSNPAPLIASDFMVSRTNAFEAAYDYAILVTWSLHPDYEAYPSLFHAARVVQGQPWKPFTWLIELSNCFTTGTTECGPDIDDDGVLDSVEAGYGTNPGMVDTDGDGCADPEEEALSNPAQGGARDGTYFWDFFEVTGNKSIDLQDTLLIIQHFGHGYNGGAYVDPTDNLLDRSRPDPVNFPWLTTEANDGVDLADTVSNLGSFGHGCANLP